MDSQTHLSYADAIVGGSEDPPYGLEFMLPRRFDSSTARAMGHPTVPPSQRGDYRGVEQRAPGLRVVGIRSRPAEAGVGDSAERIKYGQDVVDVNDAVAATGSVVPA